MSLLFTSFHLSLSSLCRHLLPPFFQPSLPLPLFFPCAIPFAPLIPLVLATVCLFLAPFFLSSFLFLLFLFASPYRRGLLFIRFFNAAVRNSGREAPQGNRKYRMGNGGEWVSPPSPSLLPLVQGGITSRWLFWGKERLRRGRRLSDWTIFPTFFSFFLSFFLSFFFVTLSFVVKKGRWVYTTWYMSQYIL